MKDVVRDARFHFGLFSKLIRGNTPYGPVVQGAGNRLVAHTADMSRGDQARCDPEAFFSGHPLAQSIDLGTYQGGAFFYRPDRDARGALSLFVRAEARSERGERVPGRRYLHIAVLIVEAPWSPVLMRWAVRLLFAAYPEIQLDHPAAPRCWGDPIWELFQSAYALRTHPIVLSSSALFRVPNDERGAQVRTIDRVAAACEDDGRLYNNTSHGGLASGSDKGVKGRDGQPFAVTVRPDGQPSMNENYKARLRDEAPGSALSKIHIPVSSAPPIARPRQMAIPATDSDDYLVEHIRTRLSSFAQALFHLESRDGSRFSADSEIRKSVFEALTDLVRVAIIRLAEGKKTELMRVCDGLLAASSYRGIAPDRWEVFSLFRIVLMAVPVHEFASAVMIFRETDEGIERVGGGDKRVTGWRNVGDQSADEIFTFYYHYTEHNRGPSGPLLWWDSQWGASLEKAKENVLSLVRGIVNEANQPSQGYIRGIRIN